MMTIFRKYRVSALSVAFLVLLSSFTICQRVNGMETHVATCRLEAQDEGFSPDGGVTPPSGKRSHLTAFDGGGTYGG